VGIAAPKAGAPLHETVVQMGVVGKPSFAGAVTSIWFTRMTELKVRIRRPESGPLAVRRDSAAWAGRTWPIGPGKQALRAVRPAVLMKVRRFMVLRPLVVVAREDRLFEVDEGSPGLRAFEESRSGGWNAFERARWTPHDRADHIVEYAYEHAGGVQRSPAANGRTGDRRDCGFAPASLPWLCLLAWLILTRDCESRHNASPGCQAAGQQPGGGGRGVGRTLRSRPRPRLLREGQRGTVCAVNAPDQAARLSPQVAGAGPTPSDICPGDFGRLPAEQDAQVLRTGKPLIDHLERQWYLPRKPVWCLTTKLPLRDAAGKVTGLIGISRDVRAPVDPRNIPVELAAALESFEENLAESVTPASLAGGRD